MDGNEEDKTLRWKRETTMPKKVTKIELGGILKSIKKASADLAVFAKTAPPANQRKLDLKIKTLDKAAALILVACENGKKPLSVTEL